MVSLPSRCISIAGDGCRGGDVVAESAIAAACSSSEGKSLGALLVTDPSSLFFCSIDGAECVTSLLVASDVSEGDATDDVAVASVKSDAERCFSSPSLSVPF